MGKIRTRMGDGSRIELTEAELMQELEAGSEDAASRARIDPLTKEEIKHLFDIFSCSHRFVSVDEGNEVVLTYDGAPIKMIRTGVSVNRIQSMQIYEKLLGADTLEMAHVDYSYKPIKPIISWEQNEVEQALMVTTAPMFYGAMPNLGLYSQPDGPFPNPGELMPEGKIDEALGILRIDRRTGCQGYCLHCQCNVRIGGGWHQHGYGGCRRGCRCLGRTQSHRDIEGEISGYLY